ncbi:hypothetical protein ACFL9T_23550 [Thermodesulfobacteriota bacterium]
MRKILLLIGSMALLFPSLALCDEFLEAPVFPGGESVQKSDSRLVIKTSRSHPDIVQFYHRTMKDWEDIKFREWKDATYIEDDGKRPWHSITISKGDMKERHITIVKDNWTWIIGTLVLRYIGVFVVLMILFLGMSLSGKIISRTVQKMEAKK